jgi:xanthine dehydrogenase YagR molybdenum-binding subunit
MQIRGGCDKDGKLTAWDWRSFGGVGYSGSGGGVNFPRHYLEDLKRRESHKDLACDTDPPRPMRAPGWPQGYFGGELFVDELAAKAGIDPLVFRQKNDPQVIRKEQWQLGAEKFGWAKRRNPKPGSPMPGDDPRWLRGLGTASARWGGMGGPGRPPHGITCRIMADGSVETRSGAQDIGTGMKTVMVLLTAEELGIPPASVKAFMGHTSDARGPGSGGSTTTPSLAPAVRHAAFLAKQELAQLVAKHLGVKVEDVRWEGGKVGAGAPMMSFADACKLIGPNPIEVHGQRFPNYKSEAFNNGVCGCQFAEVLVDTWTGIVRVVKMLAIQDCGIVIAKKLAESQVLGAMIQGVSYALHEQRIMDKRSGRMLNGDFLRYKIAGTVDMPDLRVEMWSLANGHNNVGAVGLGEPPSVAAPAAVANAVFNAIGVPVRHLPITPEKVLKALDERKGG